MSNIYNIKKQSFILFFSLLFSGVFYGQTPGSIDESFNPLDRGHIDGPSSPIDFVDTQSSGKIIICGAFPNYGENVAHGIARLNPIDGKLDSTFSGLTSINGSIYSATVLTDDKILLTGDFTQLNGISRNQIAKLNSNGTLDTTFDTSIGVSSSVFDAKVQSDGKILVFGSFTTINGVSRNSIARLNTDGTLDTSFDVGTGVIFGVEQEQIADLLIQPDGKIIICGTFLNYNGTPSRCIARLNSNGSIDTSFNIGTGTNYYISRLALQSDGKIIISGIFTSYNGTGINHIARLNTNGTLDTTFSIGSGVTSENMTPAILNIAIQNDNKLILCGGLQTINGVIKNKIVRLNLDGSIDTSFNIGTGFLQNSSYTNNWGMHDLKILSNNKIIVVGDCATFNGIVKRRMALLNSDGSLDLFFNASYGTNDLTLSIAMQPDGKSIIAGAFSKYYQTHVPAITRINSDGSIDPLFNVGTGPNGGIYKVKVQSDGKIIVAGVFTSFNGTPANRIARLHSNGTLDTSFNIGTGADAPITDFIIQPDGKIILIGNSLFNFNGVACNNIVRLNSNGSLDTGFNFNFNLGTSKWIQCLGLLNDGKIIIGGNFGAGSSIKSLNSNGNINATYSPASLNNTVYCLTIQNDNKVIIGGLFTNGLKRLNSDGSLDNSLSTIVTSNNIGIWGMKLINDKLLIYGDFHSVNGTSRKGMAILNTNGTLESSFDIGTGIKKLDYLYNYIANTSIASIFDTAIQTDGKIITVGNFTSFNGISKDNIIRLNAGSFFLNNQHYEMVSNNLILYPNPTIDIVNITTQNEIITQVNVYDLFGRLLKSQKGISNTEKINIQDLPNAMYLIEAKTDNGTKTLKIIKH